MTYRLFEEQQAAGEASDLSRQSRIRVGCALCGSGRSRLVCSAEEIASQRAFLEQFYRRRWREQSAATATDRLSFTQDYATGIMACRNCGLLYRNPRPRSDAVVKAYERERYDGAYLWAEFEAQCVWARTRIRALEKQLVTGRRRPRVLEVGSFVGGFLAEGRARGWEMLGIDPGRDVTAFCRGQRLPVFEGTIEEAALPPGAFDAIAVWNTFDQLPDPHRLLTQAMRLLRDGGLFVVRVPNGACFDWAMSAHRWLSAPLQRLLDIALAWNNLLSFPYLYGYSVGQLARLTSTYGFRVAKCLPDQVSSTPDGQLTRFGSLEERAVKSICRVAAGLFVDGQSTCFRLAPWLDVYFERACTDEKRAPALALGVFPVYAPLAFEDTGSDCRRFRWDREGG